MSNPDSNEKVMLPHHYARWGIEPQFFITVNELDKNRGDVIKRIMRWDAKDGIIDLYKAARDLDIYTTFQEEKTDGVPFTQMQFAETPSPLEALKRYIRRNDLYPTNEQLLEVIGWANTALTIRKEMEEIENG